MIIQNKLCLIILGLIVIYSCKKEDTVTASIKNSSLTVMAPDSFSLAGARIVCNTALDLSGEDYTYGFCYNLTRNPVIPGPAVGSQNYSSGSFSSMIPNLEYGKTYYIKAFVTNGIVVKYSNEDSFTMPKYISTGLVKNIMAGAVNVDITMQSNIPGRIDSWGICYNTSTKPVDTNFTILSSTTDPGTITMHITDTLKAGITYYLRSFVISNGRAFYGNEASFKTVGYKGSSGGYVFFDKGDSTGGWRYLEAAPDTVSFANVVWGCPGISVPGINPAIGTGYENSNAIVANCSADNLAAKNCRTLLFNTKTDWFLPSIDELNALYQLKIFTLISRTDKLLSSTQASANECLILNFSTGQQEQLSKIAATAWAWPVRRF